MTHPDITRTEALGSRYVSASRERFTESRYDELMRLAFPNGYVKGTESLSEIYDADGNRYPQLEGYEWDWVEREVNEIVRKEANENYN